MFKSARYYGRELAAAELPRVQVLFETCPEYFLTMNGCRPKPDAAQAEIDDFPPSHIEYTKRWFAGLFDRNDGMIGVAVVVSDLCAPHVWHIALFLIATHLHGRGIAGEIYAAMETWMRRSGAKWLRLGVVESNVRAARFWSRRGFHQVRTRAGVDTGGRLNDIRVLVKSLEAWDIAGYLALVPRDQPDSMLP